ncbi:hypothetical protein [Priestia megaterium]|uniref:hypothetical protein n=1 Tax=Priestia megaterium TaxID=1404 RepID=UPI000BEB7C99|nr:hypothetical protein [Priestia megaterium]PED63386.1 hypothetical protein CON20_26980 [Priestia megaterium]
MNEPSNLSANRATNTRTDLRRERTRDKLKGNKLIWILVLTSIVCEIIFALKLYKLYSTSTLPLSLIIVYLSLTTILFFFTIIVILRQIRVKADNPYYQYLFVIISTIIGFTFSSSFQEFLNEHEEKETLIATLKPSIEYYIELENDLMPIHITTPDGKRSVYPTPEYFREGLLANASKLKVNRETLLNVIYNNPQSFKGLSPELRSFLSSSVPLNTTYKELVNLDLKDKGYNDGGRAAFYYDDYIYIKIEVRNRRRMLQAELARLNGDLTEKQFQNKLKSIRKKNDNDYNYPESEYDQATYVYEVFNNPLPLVNQ